MISTKNALLLAAVVLLSATLCVAQTSSTSLSGTVYDPSGAVIGGANVTATSDATGVSLKQVTNEAGLYSFPSIPVGTYTVAVEISGFKTARRTGITLNVGTPSVQNITLELGDTAMEVSVEAAAVPVNTSNATLGNIVERAAVITLPLNGRNPLNLIVLEPGVVQTGSTGVNVNGMRGQSGNVTIDGIEANEASNPTPVNNVFRINPDNVQEFKVTTSNPTPEEGKNAGLNVSIATRSGGNDFHLSLIEYFRNTVLNANESFANALGNPRTNIKSNQYGFDVSGPIKKNKTFFYGAWQGQKVNLQLAIDKAFGRIPRLYTPQALSGVFRYFVADPANPFVINGQRITANSPRLVKSDGSLADGVRNCTSAADRNCVQSYNIYGNDPLRIGGDAQVLKLLKSYPTPNNYTSGDGLNTAGYLWNTPFQVRGPRNLLRVDHIFNANNSVYFRVLWAEEQQLKGDPLNSRPAIYPGFPPRGEVQRPAQNWALSFRTVVSPTKVNELTLGFARFKFYFTYIDSNPDGATLPRFNFNDNANADVHYVNQPHSIRWLNTPQIIDNFSWIKGAHQMKFGANLRFYQQNNQNSSGQNNTVPQITFSSSINPPGAAFGLPAQASGSNAGINSNDNTRLLGSINDLLGIPAQLRATFLSNLNTDAFIPSKTSDYYSVWATGERLKQINGYAQDEWRARKNVTLTYGVRWEYNKPPTESSQPVFVPDKPIDGSQGPVTFVRAKSWWQRSNLTAFAPRIGLTTSPWGDKTVIRAGWGISFDTVSTFFATAAANSIPGIAFACISTVNGSTTPGCSSVPNLRISQGFPTELPPPNIKPSTFLSPPPQPFNTAPDIAVIDPNLKQATVHQWNLSIQRQLPGEMVLQVAYVGNRGMRLYSNLDANPISAAPILSQFLAMQANDRAGCRPDGTGCPSGVTGQSIPLVASGVVTAAFANSSATITDLRQNAAGNLAGRIEQTTTAAKIRPNQQFRTAAYLSNGTDSVYHSMQTTLRRRFANGLLFNMAYTWSKVIDNQSSDPVGTSGTPGASVGGVINPYNLRDNRGVANWDRTHVWTTTWIYELPFGKGRKWMSNGSGVMNALLGGWSIQGFNALMSGSPFSISSGSRTAFFGSGSGTNGNSRAALVGNTQPDAKLKNKPGVIGPVFFTDGSAFTFAAPGTTGLGRNTFRGPGYWDVDASISKSFKFKERQEVMFRLEAFNALNHTNYRSLSDATTGDTRFNNPNFGLACCQTRPTATSTAIVSNGEAYRVVQGVLRFSF